jgi:hypothetical protein
VPSKINVCIGGAAGIDYSKDKHGKFNNQLLAFLDDSGFAICDMEKSDIFLLINYSSSAYRKYKTLGKDINKCILLRTEPESIFPAQYKLRVTRKFGLVITTGQQLEEKDNLFYVCHPYSYLKNPNLQMSPSPSIDSILESKEFDDLFNLENWWRRPIIVSLIAGNKVSCQNNSNYALRRKLAANFNPNLLEVYGEMWNKQYTKKLLHRLGVILHCLRNFTLPNLKSVYGSFFHEYKTFKNKLDDKHSVVKQSKFSLIVENSNTYVSEKLFDAMINGSIPIYFGPNLDEIGIPSIKLVLNLNSSLVQVEKKILSITKLEVLQYLESIKSFLRSDVFLNDWLDQGVYAKISDKIRSHYEGNA